MTAPNTGRCKGIAIEVKCFFETIISVFKSDSIVEGGTGDIKKQEEKQKEEVE